MAFTKEKIKQLAYITRVKVTDEEAELIVKDFEGTMAWLETFISADTKGVEPLTSFMNVTMPFNRDEVKEGDQAELVVSEAPEKEGTFFVVPKVVE